MGIRLVEEVLHYAPEGLDTAARLVLVVIAQNANDTTRLGYPGMDVLARRSGLTPDGVQKVLRRLASHHLEVRVPLGKDKNGRPFFAARGKQSTYMVPHLRADHSPPIEARKPGPQSAHSAEKARTTGRERADERPRKGGPQSAPSPQDLLRSPQGEARGSESTPPTTSVPPSPRCSRHLDEDNPPNCGACGDARRARTRWDIAEGERRRNAPQCPRHRGELAHSCRPCASERLAPVS